MAPDQDASLGMRRAKSLRKKMNEVDTFATARGLPEQLRHALSDYYNDAWMAHEGECLRCCCVVSLTCSCYCVEKISQAKRDRSCIYTDL